MAPVNGFATIEVTVACSPAVGVAEEVGLSVCAGSTLLEGLQASGLLARYPGIDISTQATGIWGQLRSLDTVLREGDRIEVYRPLPVNPMEARRRRQRRQKAICSPTR